MIPWRFAALRGGSNARPLHKDDTSPFVALSTPTPNYFTVVAVVVVTSSSFVGQLVAQVQRFEIGSPCRRRRRRRPSVVVVALTATPLYTQRQSARSTRTAQNNASFSTTTTPPKTSAATLAITTQHEAALQRLSSTTAPHSDCERTHGKEEWKVRTVTVSSLSDL